jgi:hypothetical protein
MGNQEERFFAEKLTAPGLSGRIPMPGSVIVLRQRYMSRNILASRVEMDSTLM